VISKLTKKKPAKKKKKKKQKKKKNSPPKRSSWSTHIQPLDEKSHPIQWTEFPTGALVGACSCWP
jgi:hypothetical protein